MDILAFAFLVATAWGVVRLRDLFASAMLLGLFSLLSAALFTVMDAVDVAFTEASVGAGISTVLFLATLAVTRRFERVRAERADARRRLGAMALVTVLGLLLGWASLQFPHYGDASAPIHQHVAPRYLEKSPDEVGPPNIVTSVLASYRGYDTFGETTVVFTALLGVLLLLSGKPKPEEDVEALPDDDPRRATHSGTGNPVLRVGARPLIPFILMFALYVQFHGDYGPGGGFQAGVIFAAGVVLCALIWGLDQVRTVFTPRRLEVMVALGVLIYGLVGVASMLRGGAFLEYSVLLHDPKHGQHWGILLVEFGVGLAVTAVMINLFMAFAGRGRRHPRRDPRQVPEAAP